jgi:hypothetical protein
MRTSRFQFSVKPQEALLILITMFWGGTFLAVQYAVTMSGPFFLSACVSRRLRWRWVTLL